MRSHSGMQSRAKSMMCGLATVNNTRLAAIAAWYRLHPFLRYFSQALFGEIAGFVDSVREARKKGVKRKIMREF